MLPAAAALALVLSQISTFVTRRILDDQSYKNRVWPINNQS